MKDEKDVQGEINEEIEQEEYDSVIEDLLNDRLREVDFESKDKIDLTQSDEFQDGLSKALYYAGFYSGLRNYGMNSSDSFNLTLNEHTCNHNLELAKVQDKQLKDLDNTNVMGFHYTPDEEYEDYEEE
jgi:hypothetical protein